MNLKETEIPGVCILEPRVFRDSRGFFMESYNKRTLEKLGIERDFVQDNHSKSTKFVLRGLHYQLGSPQAKLVSVVKGRVFDVAVDIRRGSPYFGKWVGVELSEDNRRQFFVPEGFAHGFLVLSEEAEFQYKCSDFYAPSQERGLLWCDDRLGIQWPIPEGVEPILSEKDLAHPDLQKIDSRELPLYDEPS